MKIVLEVGDGKILGVTADAENVELLVVDYDFEGHLIDDQDCAIVTHAAVLDSEKVATISAEATRTDEAK